MKFLIPAAIALILPVAACAQTPGSTPDALPGAVAPDVAAVYLDPDQRIGQSEAVLREVIASGQTGDFTHPLMSERFLVGWTPQIESFQARLKAYGPLQSVQHVGLEREAERFQVEFANARTDWVIGFENDGKIGILMFRDATPAPAVTLQPQPEAAD